MASFFNELKRRKVFRVAVAYLLVGWVVVQVADVVFPTFEAPDWVLKVLTALMALGFPVALLLAWAYDLTPEGIVRTPDEEEEESGDANDKPASLPASAPPEHSIAVLPFVDMSPGGDHEYFSDGLTESLLHSLTQVAALKVAARTSAFAFKGRNEDIRAIGEKLGVAKVLEGSVRKSGDKVLITAQLVNAADGYHLWSETYNRSLDDIFAVQEDIASSVVEALKVTILGAEAARLECHCSTSGEAYNNYLMGLHFHNRGSIDDYRRAIEYFEESIDRDPDCASAYAGLSDAVGMLARHGAISVAEGAARSRAAAEKAIALDPGLAAGHVVMARLQESFDWDWAGAGASFIRALELSPGDVEARHYCARHLLARERFDEALAEAEYAIELDPLSQNAARTVARILYYARRYDEAMAALDRLFDINPDDDPALYWLGLTHLMIGHHEKALAAFKRHKEEIFSWQGQALAFHALGDTTMAALMSDKVEARYGGESGYQLAEIHGYWGEAGKCLEWLEKACDLRDPGLAEIRVSPHFDLVRLEPRYLALVGKIGLADK